LKVVSLMTDKILQPSMWADSAKSRGYLFSGLCSLWSCVPCRWTGTLVEACASQSIPWCFTWNLYQYGGLDITCHFIHLIVMSNRCTKMPSSITKRLWVLPTKLSRPHSHLLGSLRCRISSCGSS
jgi:hypothetical protein